MQFDSDSDKGEEILLGPPESTLLFLGQNFYQLIYGNFFSDLGSGG